MINNNDDLREVVKKIDFGKIDFNRKGRRNHRVEIEVRLGELGDKPVFSAMADVWNTRGTDIVMGGQCLDELVPFLGDRPLFKKIYGWWKKYHNNDLHPGTPEQENYLKEYKERKDPVTGRSDYTRDCEILKKAGLYEVDLNGEPYRYGTAWLHWPIPKDDIEEIVRFFESQGEDGKEGR